MLYRNLIYSLVTLFGVLACRPRPENSQLVVAFSEPVSPAETRIPVGFWKVAKAKYCKESERVITQCNGIRISQNFVATVLHCVLNDDDDRTTERLVFWNTYEEMQKYLPDRNKKKCRSKMEFEAVYPTDTRTIRYFTKGSITDPLTPDLAIIWVEGLKHPIYRPQKFQTTDKQMSASGTIIGLGTTDCFKKVQEGNESVIIYTDDASKYGIGKSNMTIYQTPQPVYQHPRIALALKETIKESGNPWEIYGIGEQKFSMGCGGDSGSGLFKINLNDKSLALVGVYGGKYHLSTNEVARFNASGEMVTIGKVDRSVNLSSKAACLFYEETGLQKNYQELNFLKQLCSK